MPRLRCTAAGALLVLFGSACEVPGERAEQREAPAPPDTLVRAPGTENARAWCRESVRRRLPEDARPTFQEDALVRDLGSHRYEVEGRVVLRANGEDRQRRFRCTMAFDEAEGWAAEEVRIERLGRGGGDEGAGADAEVSG